ncbi:hypothetical protein VTI28DRAFT_9953 [Corynascus sepedonium]
MVKQRLNGESVGISESARRGPKAGDLGYLAHPPSGPHSGFSACWGEEDPEVGECNPGPLTLGRAANSTTAQCGGAEVRQNVGL